MPNRKPNAQHSRFGWLKKFDWSFTAFIASLCGITFGYGLAAAHWNLFPYTQLLHARMAYSALMQLSDSQIEFNTVKIEEGADSVRQVSKLDPRAGNELLLVTGGPSQDAEHCPKFGCLAWIVDRKGKVLHSWPLKLEEMFAHSEGFYGPKNISHFYPIGLQLLDDGSLIATFQGFHRYPYAAGLARIAWNGDIIWKHVDFSHHWPKVGPDGTIYAPTFVGTKMEYFGDTAIKTECETPVYNEGVRIYGPDGKIRKTILLAEALEKSGYTGLLYGLRDGCDPVHLNSIDVVTPDLVGKVPDAAAGDLLVSLRESSSLALVGTTSGLVKHVFGGHTAAQHSAHFLPDGNVLVFDNLGGDRTLGGSRIVQLDLIHDKAQTVYPRKDDPLLPFSSSNGGHISISPDGKRAITSSKDQGRAIEFDIATGKPLWTMTEVLDLGPFLSEDRKSKKPVAAWFKLWGTYYVPPEQAKKLPL
ncbi:MAG: arylsulfotransferase family protein [Sphingobium sp.]